MGHRAPRTVHCMDTLLRLPRVVEITGVPTSTLYLKISQGAFPAPVKIGPRAVAWRASDIAAWLDALKPREVAK